MALSIDMQDFIKIMVTHTIEQLVEDQKQGTCELQNEADLHPTGQTTSELSDANKLMMSISITNKSRPRRRWETFLDFFAPPRQPARGFR